VNGFARGRGPGHAEAAPRAARVFAAARAPFEARLPAHRCGIRAACPNPAATIERKIAAGEWVASVITARGTHAAAWLGIMPSGKPLAFTGVKVDRVGDGRLVEFSSAADVLEPCLGVGSPRPVAARSATAARPRCRRSVRGSRSAVLRLRPEGPCQAIRFRTPGCVEAGRPPGVDGPQSRISLALADTKTRPCTS